MKGLPKTFDSSVFMGKTIDQVSFTINTVSLNFDAGLILTVVGAFEHGPILGGSGHEVSEPPVSESRLMQLAGHRVTGAKVEDDGGLSLVFEDGQSLRCIRGPEPFHVIAITRRGFGASSHPRHWLRHGHTRAGHHECSRLSGDSARNVCRTLVRRHGTQFSWSLPR